MNAFADTSLLCALYRVQENSETAYSLAAGIYPITVSSMVLFEFRQSVRLQAFRYCKDRTQGYSSREAARVQEALQSNLDSGALIVAPVDWAEAQSIAGQLSAQYTALLGNRMVDILHVATALHLEAEQFLTLDIQQSKLAKAARLNVRP